MLRNRQTRFLVITLGLFGVLQGIYMLVPDPVLRDSVYHPLMVTVATDLINLIRPDLDVVGQSNQIVSRLAVLEIVRGCDGIGLLLLMWAPIVAFPTTLRRKLIGLAIATVGIYLLNQARIVALFFVVAYRNDWFLPLHTYLIPTFLVMICLIFFHEWTRRANQTVTS